MEDTKDIINLSHDYMVTHGYLPNNIPIKIYCEHDGIGNISVAHNTKWPDEEGNNIEYIRKDVVEYLIAYASDIQDALMKIKSL